MARTGPNHTARSIWLMLKNGVFEFFYLIFTVLGMYFLSLSVVLCYVLSSDWSQAGIFAMIDWTWDLLSPSSEFCPVIPHAVSMPHALPPLYFIPFPLLSSHPLSILPSYVSNWVFISQQTDKTHLFNLTVLTPLLSENKSTNLCHFITSYPLVFLSHTLIKISNPGKKISVLKCLSNST